MEKLKAIRGGHRSAVTRLINRTKERISQEDIGHEELSAAADNLTKKRNLLESLDSQILDGTELEDMEQEILDADDYAMNMEVVIRRFKDIVSGNKTTPFQQTVSETTYVPIANTLDSSNFPSTSIANHNSNHSENVFTVDNNSVYTNANPTTATNFYHKLPKLDLPNFTGDILTWQTFWESFETTIHHNPSLTNIQKFSYLKSQVHSEAAQCISGLSLSNANYEHAIILLKERYGQTQTIINAYMQNLLELTHPSLTPQSIRAFYDKMESCIRGLESLGQSQDTFGSLLVPIIFGKLPDEMRKLMTREHGKKNWDIRSLREAIGKEMHVQETGFSNQSDNFTPTASFYTAAKPKSYSRPQSGNYQTKPKTCIYCKQSHSSLECTTVVDREKRFSIIKQKKVCYNCFGSHKVSECRSRFRCRKCDKKHHTSLCDSNKNQEKESDNRYIAKLPWKEDFPELPSNYNITKRRTLSLINRLSREPEMMKVYGDIIADQEKRGFVEKVQDENAGEKIHYIPHHAVKKDSPTTPIRIVYDCSCRESSDKPSLNDCLMSVPPQMNELTGIIARFRLHQYAATTDIEKAFLQIELDEKDRDVTRFFWLSEPADPTSQLITYRFRVVLFGTTCSPFILNATLLKHLNNNSSITANMLKKDLYVDNVLSSFQTEESMMTFYKESRELLSKGGFNLRSWTSNNVKLRQVAATENSLDKSKSVKILDQLTRGTSAEKFVQNKLWMHGPEWITNEHQWPSWHGNMTTTSLIVNEEDEEPVASLVLPAQTENTGARQTERHFLVYLPMRFAIQC
ncbi:Hypothetical predicted protein [Mytilus galloprovincialis]|uniref:Reverse transcriptase domain-containing protein n=1 Tax=Mytilus galloprovincialis TaxID=29158 RepID=A0A8B6FKU8_MYTGA|nr:Hypothetical predicted protein [Mytilus galloprovincialis]